MINNQEKSKFTKQVEEIKNIIEEYTANPDDYDLDKTVEEIRNICTQPVRDSQVDQASYGALDAEADRGEE